MKMLRLEKGLDGRTAFVPCTAIVPRASLACSVLAATLTSDVLKSVTSDDGPSKIDPRKLAKIACDIANAMYDEIEGREWIMEYPVPEGHEVLGSI
jgi:hypothetical protein